MFNQEENIGESHAESTKIIANEIFINSNHMENVVDFKSTENSETIKVKILVKPGEKEELQHKNKFVVEININVTYIVKQIFKDGSSEGLLCREASFVVNGIEVRFEDIAPKGVDLCILSKYDTSLAGEENGLYNPNDGGSVNLINFYSPGSFITMLHEIGHALEDANRNEGEKEILRLAKDERAIMQRSEVDERNAWANALRIAKKYELPIMGDIKREMERCLEIYQKKADELGVRAKISNKKRKNDRKN
jgi:hypothetical protein